MIKLKPLLKWYGSKRRLLDRLVPALLLNPDSPESFTEPFFGSGAVSFHLLANKLVKFSFASDLNPALVNFYNSLSMAKDIVKACEVHKKEHSYEYYYAQRDIDTSKLNQIEWASWFHYMNKTGYNGLYRCNLSGAYSTPYNGVASYNPPDLNLMLTYGDLMKNVHLENKPFSITEEDEGLIYLDPPYYTEDRASRVDYGCPVFDHVEFLRTLQDCGDKVKWAMSHKENTSFDDLIMSQGYVKSRIEFDFKYVAASKSSSRKDTKEILYRSF